MELHHFEILGVKKFDWILQPFAWTQEIPTLLLPIKRRPIWFGKYNFNHCIALNTCLKWFWVFHHLHVRTNFLVDGNCQEFEKILIKTLNYLCGVIWSIVCNQFQFYMWYWKKMFLGENWDFSLRHLKRFNLEVMYKLNISSLVLCILFFLIIIIFYTENRYVPMDLHELCRGAENWTFVGTVAANGEFLRILPHESQRVFSGTGSCFWSWEPWLEGLSLCFFPEYSQREWSPWFFFRRLGSCPSSRCCLHLWQKCTCLQPALLLKTVVITGQCRHTLHTGFSCGRTFLEVLLRIADSG